MQVETTLPFISDGPCSYPIHPNYHHLPAGSTTGQLYPGYSGFLLANLEIIDLHVLYRSDKGQPILSAKLAPGDHVNETTNNKE